MTLKTTLYLLYYSIFISLSISETIFCICGLCIKIRRFSNCNISCTSDTVGTSTLFYKCLLLVNQKCISFIHCNLRTVFHLHFNFFVYIQQSGETIIKLEIEPCILTDMFTDTKAICGCPLQFTVDIIKNKSRQTNRITSIAT